MQLCIVNPFTIAMCKLVYTATKKLHTSISNIREVVSYTPKCVTIHIWPLGLHIALYVKCVNELYSPEMCNNTHL